MSVDVDFARGWFACLQALAAARCTRCSLDWDCYRAAQGWVHRGPDAIAELTCWASEIRDEAAGTKRAPGEGSHVRDR